MELVASGRINQVVGLSVREASIILYYVNATGVGEYCGFGG